MGTDAAGPPHLARGHEKRSEEVAQLYPPSM